MKGNITAADVKGFLPSIYNMDALRESQAISLAPTPVPERGSC
jgi:hypothetical protein